MTTLTIDRSKISAEELFELHLILRPGLQMVPQMEGKRIEIGQKYCSFVAQGTVDTDGVLLIWSSKTEWTSYDSGLLRLWKGDELRMTLRWGDF